MAESILSKLRVITLGNVHQLLDAVIDLNSLPVVKQYVRDLEGGIAQMIEAVSTAEGGLTTVTRDITNAQALAKELDSDIEALTSDDDETNDHLALPMQVRLNATNKRLGDLEALRDQRKENVTRLNTTISRLQAKHEEMLAEVQRLEELAEETEGMKKSTKAMQSAAKLSSVDAPSIDNVARRMQEKYDNQKARFDRAMDSVSDATSDSDAIAAAEADLARRRSAKKQTA